MELLGGHIDGFCFKLSTRNIPIKLQASTMQMIEFDNKHKTDKRITFYIKQNSSYFYVKNDVQGNFKSFCNQVVN